MASLVHILGGGWDNVGVGQCWQQLEKIAME